jgi:hypothetical protein
MTGGEFAKFRDPKKTKTEENDGKNRQRKENEKIRPN